MGQATVAIGSVHGTKRDIQPLNIERLTALRDRTCLPLVMHGASGVLRTRKDAGRVAVRLKSHEGILEDAIKCGPCKVSVGTEINMCLIRGIRRAFEQNPKVGDIRKLVLRGKNETK